MAIALTMNFEGDGRDVLSLYNQANVEMRTHQDPPPGLILHWAAKTSNGLRVVDLWESQADFDKFFRERLGPTSQKLGLPQPTVETLEVYGMVKGKAAATI